MKLKIIIVRNLDPKCERIKDRLTDFTIFCVQQYCPYQVVNSIDEAVFPEDCKYILFIKAGHLFWDTSIFEKCIAKVSTVSGDANWLLVDVKKLDGKPVDRSNPTPFDDEDDDDGNMHVKGSHLGSLKLLLTAGVRPLYCVGAHHC